MNYTLSSSLTQQVSCSLNPAMSLLVFITLFTLTIFCLQSTAQAQTPSASITVLYADRIDEPVVFDGTASTGVGDFDDGIIEWDFGDGFKAKILRATHVYRKAGTYTVRLTVKSSSGGTSTATTTVTVNNIPTGNDLPTSNRLTVVRTGGNGTTTFNTIQEAVNKAATLNGSAPVEITLPTGDPFDEAVTLTVPVGNNYITLKSSQLGNLPAGRRVDRSNLSNFATMLAPNADNAVKTTISSGVPSHHYRFQGIQFKTKPGANIVYWILSLGQNEPVQNSLAMIPHHLIIDRCLIYSENVYLVGTPPNQTNRNATRNGINLLATRSSVLDSYISNINEPGNECHAIAVFNTVGVLGIVNNYLESGSVNVLFGGTIPYITGSIIADVEFRRNHNRKPLEKRSLHSDPLLRWSAKNNYEMKVGKYFVIEGNIFEGNWIGWDQRYLVNFNALAEDTGNQTKIEDTQFTQNILRYGPNGFLMSKIDPASSPKRVLVAHNLITNIGGIEYGVPGGDGDGANGKAFIIGRNFQNLVINHNTLLTQWGIIDVDGESYPLIYTNNISNHGTSPYGDGYGWGIKGNGTNPGNSTFNVYFPDPTVRKNIIAGMADSPYPNPSENGYYRADTNPPESFSNINDHFVDVANGNYHIAIGTPGYHWATDGTDVGVNLESLATATRGTVTGLWNNPKPSDFDGDGKTDIAVWRPSDGTWYILQSSNATLRAQAWGTSGDVIVPGDYDADGKTDTAVFRPSNTTWYILNSSDSTTSAVVFGLGTDTPVPRDYDGDGKTDIAVWRSSTSTWYISQSSNGVLRSEVFGTSGDKLVPGDYDQDGRVDIAVFRPSTSYWYILQSYSGTTRTEQFGSSGDLPVPGLYDGDSKTDIAVFRPSNNTWYVLQSTNNITKYQQWGLSTDKFESGDYDGDGRTDFSVFRPSNNNWYILQSANNSSSTQTWGSSGDISVPSAYIPQ